MRVARNSTAKFSSRRTWSPAFGRVFLGKDLFYLLGLLWSTDDESQVACFLGDRKVWVSWKWLVGVVEPKGLFKECISFNGQGR